MKTRLTTLFDLSVPVALAPMALACGGALAAACARAGALGLVGGGYGDLAWTQREYTLALQAAETAPNRSRIGCGFITWKLDEDASALDWVLDRPAGDKPRALMLSFGDPRPYGARIAAAGTTLMCQVQRMEQVPQAIEAGARVIVAQGAEAGGHGMNSLNGRATMTFVPELADWLAAHAPDTLLLAAGGIADGRTLAAALVLGADGALVGSRLWATRECLAAQGAKDQAVRANGDGTARSAVFDILRRKNWPAPYDFRAIRNDLHRQWEDRVEALRADPAAARARYDAAVKAGDFSAAHATVGEAVGLINDCPSAEDVLRRMARDAAALWR
ncbi:NAD(P)H-dependent flavin oxidoreductase [Rhodoferax sediminis]|jgi:nitronate monooxygenase|uniref:Nitronate monooxygenase n=1 Tax=Rhodoferax sediminis TaxID=2509614 RepID=A0A515DGA6_9BURK|nr:nitronate monooxygenase [Rhodoferax sediminis]QDL39429.1 nitronate monooxygenase [Rhodoferax sediminis]